MGKVKSRKLAIAISPGAISFSSLTALALLTASAQAGFSPSTLLFNVTSSAGSGNSSDNAVQIAPGVYSHTGAWATDGASIQWSSNIVGWNDTTGLGFLNSNITIRNLTSSTQTFSFVVSMSGQSSGPWTLGGSVGGQFVNGSNSLGMLTSTGPLWRALIDGGSISDQFDNAGFFAQPFQVVSLGNRNFSNQAHSASIGTSVGIAYSLSLTAGGEASFTSNFNFQAIPAPAPLALMAITALMPSHRRRRR